MIRKNQFFAETEFLTLAQTLEGFGRVRFGGKRPRDAKFMELIGQTYDLLNPGFAALLIGNKQEFSLKIVQTRDYYTHLGNSRGSRATKTVKELFLLNKRLGAFLRCVMLIELGISQSYLQEPIPYEATKWR